MGFMYPNYFFVIFILREFVGILSFSKLGVSYEGPLESGTLLLAQHLHRRQWGNGAVPPTDRRHTDPLPYFSGSAVKKSKKNAKLDLIYCIVY